LAAVGYCQDCCRQWEASGSYSYFNASPKTDRLSPSVFDSRISQHGFGIDLTYNFRKSWGIVGDFSRQTADVNQIRADTTTLNFFGGVRLASAQEGMAVFAEALLGATNRKTVLGTTTLSNTDFALAFGGGVDIHASRNFSVRVLRLDYIPVRGGDDSHGIGRRWSQNFRAQVGIVYRFGG